ncbi:hypothetical protein VD659_09065 [Herbiconiux sp. 11R-BC]|uniref:hypothetical protein n=1 Tax=Herbiconiux sp. 11R-BC TaxID=3111637 RepID=UPI003C0B1B0B
MTFIAPPSSAPRPSVPDDVSLASLVDEMVGAAIRSQLWLLYLDADDRPIPVAMPLEDVAPELDDAEIDQVTCLARETARQLGAAQLVLVWEREGGPALTVGERAGIARVAERYPDGGLRLRRQFLSHSTGVVAL